ncbi:MAG: hypothetical protein AAF943_07000 [Pseudomonadota bacterium]
MKGLIAALLLIGLAACAPRTPASYDSAGVDGLAQTIASLSPKVAPQEANAAAALAFATTRRLSAAYQITDPPLIHNAKVNAGIRPRGLCHHWAEDMQTALTAAGFESLQIRRAIANADNPFRIEHSTAVLIAKGGSLDEGIVLDPWRNGGTLFWAKLQDDRRYDWQDRLEVLRKKGQVYIRRQSDAPPAEPIDD